MRIVVANEPRSYREVIAAACLAARPDMDLITVESGELDDAIIRLQPDFVICSALSEVLESRTAAWVLLYPSGESAAITNVGGTRTQSIDLALDDLLLALDTVDAMHAAG